MVWLYRFAWSFFVALPFLACAAPAPAAASETSFPFGSVLVLDAAPLPGSKRVPMIEIDRTGTVMFYLWCSRVRGLAKFDDGNITIVPAQALSAQCTSDGLSRDASLLSELSHVTGWRRQGDEIDLVGATTLRFRLTTN
jgi:hypothetical protein